MALRSTWKGSLRFSLVSVAVEAYTAAERADGEVHFNQLHDKCHSRIRYKKTCPIHGEVRNDEIVSGYEYEKDKYVVFEPGELDKLRPEGSRSIAIDTFVSPEEIDPIYYDGRTYYLAPESPDAQKPYAVLLQAMAKMNRWGMATVILHGKEELVLVRPLEGVLTMTMLHFKSQVRSPEVLKEEVPSSAKVNPMELKLAQQLIDASTDEKFDFSKYEDKHTDELKKLIEAKVAGQEIVAPPAAEEMPPVINLMDALKKSMQQKKRAAPQGKAGKARKTLAAQLSKASGQQQRRRKTS